jgi:hypothetical protein
MGARTLLLTALLATLGLQVVRADDFGPHRAVNAVRSDVRRLLAYRVRAEGVNPKDVAITDVIVSGNQALTSWDSGKSHGVMGLLYHEDRWWDAYDAVRVAAHALSQAGFSDEFIAQAGAHNADVRNTSPADTLIRSGADCTACWKLNPQGASLEVPQAAAAGYQLAIRFARNDAAPALPITQIYVRAPTHAEFLPFPTPPKDAGGPTDVGYFDVDLGGSKPVTFTQGTTVDMWFPFVLDDSLRYDISLYTNHKSSGPYRARIFDNVLHFELPAFTIVPGSPMQAEISGWY